MTSVEINLQKHEEDIYIDYDYEGLVSQMLSREGPAIAVGDINGDGNEDIYLGGAKNRPVESIYRPIQENSNLLQMPLLKKIVYLKTQTLCSKIPTTWNSRFSRRFRRKYTL